MGAGTGDGREGGTSTAAKAAGAGAGCGCLLLLPVLPGIAAVVVVFGGFGVILRVLIAIIMPFVAGGGDASSYEAEAGQEYGIVQGDGKGDLDPSTVPEDLVDPIEEAGGLCDVIGPVVVAAQIEWESGFEASLVGEKGEAGLSQLPPDVFERYGEDDDGNDEVSALDAEDSIMAQGRYLCDLADEAQEMLDADEATGTVLDLTLAAYEVGMDAVREAGGLPATNEAQSYVLAVRAQFSTFQGIDVPTPEAPQESPASSPAAAGSADQPA
ncbi:lytic transglycosylase domain-containing protein [Streptomyces mayonensis]|uniref:lytic transglycosylase domain-containing protein n=1 Tax=Streptomyces mayonensis TaxID=2750816 RepID=UPI001C1E5470|nr:lytic transglycosylase domain-containing protein [Streptomyces sp. A108]MBU6535504.1 lytic transglycosylase domain-containing protein [Streptomyces sp. A108]